MILFVLFFLNILGNFPYQYVLKTCLTNFVLSLSCRLLSNFFRFLFLFFFWPKKNKLFFTGFTFFVSLIIKNLISLFSFGFGSFFILLLLLKHISSLHKFELVLSIFFWLRFRFGLFVSGFSWKLFFSSDSVISVLSLAEFSSSFLF